MCLAGLRNAPNLNPGFRNRLANHINYRVTRTGWEEARVRFLDYLLWTYSWSAICYPTAVIVFHGRIIVQYIINGSGGTYGSRCLFGCKSRRTFEELSDEKIMIIRGAAGRKMPYGRVNSGNILYLIENDGSGLVLGIAKVISVVNSDKMTAEESVIFVEKHQSQLQLTTAQFKRWAGKRYLVLIEIESVEEVKPFSVDKSEYGNIDDWLPVGDIETVKVNL